MVYSQNLYNDRIDVKDFSEFPEMRAFEIAENVMQVISENKYDFIFFFLDIKCSTLYSEFVDVL